ncbi:O-antigen translocase [Pseudomonas fakonensis]|uniref:O-antigen translocase n=1 Tax=Pseudomonas fakonensis TaxID=2842355 RepID=A0ABX8N953_9PSED|nr:O-antigen translocase [Pseudomonas fakonensis]QXH52899.1 O-antigen translocase [Pseudomonas fakonensis]
MKPLGGLQSAALTALAHLSRIAVGFLLIKVVAQSLGPEGLGALGNFMSLATLVYMVAGGGITNGVIKLTSEYNAQAHRLIRMLSTAFSYSLVCCLVIGAGGVFFSEPLAKFVFADGDKWWLVVVLALAQFCYAYVNIVVGVGNGLLHTYVYSSIQIVGSLLAALFTVWLVRGYGFNGASLAVVAIYLMPVFPALYFHLKSNIARRIKWVRLTSSEIRRLAKFSGMVLVSAASFPVVEVVVRSALISASGYEQAGLWQGLVKLSSAYLGFFTVFLSYYFMPLVSREHNKYVIGKLTAWMLLVVMLLFVFGALVLYGWRDFFIPLLLSPDFSAATNYLGYQVVGDGFRVAAYVLGFVAVAKASLRLYVAAEILQNGLFVSMVYGMGRKGADVSVVTQAYAWTYVLYFCVAVVVFAVYLRRQRSEER